MCIVLSRLSAPHHRGKTFVARAEENAGTPRNVSTAVILSPLSGSQSPQPHLCNVVRELVGVHLVTPRPVHAVKPSWSCDAMALPPPLLTHVGATQIAGQGKGLKGIAAQFVHQPRARHRIGSFACVCSTHGNLF